MRTSVRVDFSLQEVALMGREAIGVAAIGVLGDSKTGVTISPPGSIGPHKFLPVPGRKFDA
jgi:hypothetical protein